MYKIQLVEREGNTISFTDIYDQSNMNTLSVTSPKCNLELNGPGQLTFSLMPGHPLIDSLMPLSSFVRALDDGEEIFYGRIMSRSEPKITGQVSFTCEGALNFLNDSEVSPDAKNSKGSPQPRKITATAFFQWCLEQHNAEVNDVRRNLTLGTVNVTKKDTVETYSINSYTQTRSAIESNLLNAYGGFLRIRASNTGKTHYLDWIQNYENVDAQDITLGENVIEQTNGIDAASMFTAIRPVGNNNVTLTEKTIDLYPSNLMQEYGKIVKTIDFRNANTEEELRTAATAYKNDVNKTLFKSCNVRLVDMYYIDGTSPKLKIGNRYTHLAGFEGEEMVAASLELDFENVQNSSVELKNRKALDPDLTSSGNAHSGSSRMSRAAKNASGLALKYIHELDDKVTIAVGELQIGVDDLTINVRNKFAETATTFSRISSAVDNVNGLVDQHTLTLGDLTLQVSEIIGTGVFQDSAKIVNIAGNFEVWEDDEGNIHTSLLDGSDLQVSVNNGIQQTVATQVGPYVTQIGDLSAWVTSYEGSALWTQQDKITSVVGNFDIVRTPDPENPGQFIETLVVKSGGGFNIEKDGVEYGIYMTPDTAYKEVENPEGNPKQQGWYVKTTSRGFVLTNDTVVNPNRTYYTRDPNVNAVLSGGVVVDLLNDGTTSTKIRGDIVNLGPDLTDEDLNSWAKNARDGKGVFAKFLTVKKLTAQEIATMFADIGQADIGDIWVQNIFSANKAGQRLMTIQDDGAYFDTTTYFSEPVYFEDKQGKTHQLLISDIALSNDNTSLIITKTDGSEITFRKAASGGVSSSWSGSTLTVAASAGGASSYSVTVNAPYFTSHPVNNVSTKCIEVSYTPVTGDVHTPVPIKQLYCKIGLSDAGTSDDPYTRTTYAQLQYATGSSAGAKITGSPDKILTNYWDAAKAEGTSEGIEDGKATGWAAARKVISEGWPEALESGEVASSFTVEWPSTTYGGKQTSTFTITAGTPGTTGYVAVKRSNDAVGRIDISNWYKAGWDAARQIIYDGWPGMAPEGEHTSFSVEWPSAEYGNSQTTTFVLSKGTPGLSGYVGVKRGTTTVGRIDVSDWYKAGWDAAQSKVSWPNAAPSGESTTFDVQWPSESYGETRTTTFTLTKGTPGTSGYAAVSRGTTTVGRIDISDWYKAGWDAARSKVSWPDAIGTNEEVTSFSVKWPSATYGTGVQTTTFTLSKGTPGTSGYVGVRRGTTTVGRIDISNWYKTGWKDAANKVDGFPTANTTNIGSAVTLTVPIANAGSTKKYAVSCTYSTGYKPSGSTTTFNVVNVKIGTYIAYRFDASVIFESITNAGVHSSLENIDDNWTCNLYTGTTKVSTIAASTTTGLYIPRKEKTISITSQTGNYVYDAVEDDSVVGYSKVTVNVNVPGKKASDIDLSGFTTNTPPYNATALNTLSTLIRQYIGQPVNVYFSAKLLGNAASDVKWYSIAMS